MSKIHLRHLIKVNREVTFVVEKSLPMAAPTVILTERATLMITTKIAYYIFLISFLVYLTQSRTGAHTDTHNELTVFAAASLTEAFQVLGKNFEVAHPPVKIRFNFGGSQQLVQQMAHGAKADIFASADMKQMNAAKAAGVVDTSSITTFARNRLVVVFPKDNIAHLSKLRDLTNKNVKIILADSSVPVGRYALQVLDRCSSTKEFGKTFKGEVLKNVVSYEENVRAVLSKVQLGECDAGIVYSSDVAHDSLHRVVRLDIPDELNSIAEYPLGIVKTTALPHTARELYEYILSDEGKKVLSTFGFMTVPLPGKK